MCATYTLHLKRDQFLRAFEIQISENLVFERKILPQSSSFVVVENAGLKLKPMIFSLTPSWSKEAKVKFATHNARIESILEKPTWRGPLKSNRCLVPISEFIEPIYTGHYAGNMVKFKEAKQELLVAAGIFDIWENKVTGEIKESFAIITTEPPEFIAKIGHDRCPLFLKKTAFHSWLDSQRTDSKASIALLRDNCQTLEFAVEIDRPLAKGWEKRA